MPNRAQQAFLEVSSNLLAASQPLAQGPTPGGVPELRAERKDQPRSNQGCHAELIMRLSHQGSRPQTILKAGSPTDPMGVQIIDWSRILCLSSSGHLKHEPGPRDAVTLF